MELTPIYKRIIGLDVHQAQITGCAIPEDEHGEVHLALRQFGTFKKDRRALAEWAATLVPDQVVIGKHWHRIYWKSPFAALESVGLQPLVVNSNTS